MKVAIISESPADEAIYRVLVDAAIGIATTPPSGAALRVRSSYGVEPTLRSLKGLVLGLCYNSDAEGLVVILDSNGTRIHDRVGECEPHECRYCRAQMAASEAITQSQRQLKVAIGLAVPAIEAWWLSATDGAVTESAWRMHLDRVRAGQHRPPYTRQTLKESLYGRKDPTAAIQLANGLPIARQAVADVVTLRHKFPNGLGPLLDELARWKPQTQPVAGA
jgi:hypothetical protein